MGKNAEKGPGQVVLPRARIFPGGSGIPAAAVFLPILLQMLFEEFCHLPEVESASRSSRNHVVPGVRKAFKSMSLSRICWAVRGARWVSLRLQLRGRLSRSHGRARVKTADYTCILVLSQRRASFCAGHRVSTFFRFRRRSAENSSRRQKTWGFPNGLLNAGICFGL